MPDSARIVEEMRASGIEDESWWDNYRGSSYSDFLPSLNMPSLSAPSRGRSNPFMDMEPATSGGRANPFR